MIQFIDSESGVRLDNYEFIINTNLVVNLKRERYRLCLQAIWQT